MKKFQRNGLRTFAADADHGVDPQLAGVGDYGVGNVANDFLAIFNGAVLERIAAIGGAENGAATRQNAAHILEGQFVGFFRPDQPVEAVRDADDLPFVFQDGAFHHGANDGIEAGCVAAAGANPNTADSGHCTVMVTVLLLMPLRVAKM